MKIDMPQTSTFVPYFYIAANKTNAEKSHTSNHPSKNLNFDLFHNEINLAKMEII